MKEGDAVSAMIINVDRKNRSINLSIKAKDNADESEAMQRISSENSSANNRHDQSGRVAQGQAGPEKQQLITGATAMTKSELIDR